MNDASSSRCARRGPSKRLQTVQAPIIPAIAALIRAHYGTISLGQGMVHYPPPVQALARFQGALTDPNTHSYGQAQGLPLLKQAIARKLDAENGMSVANLDRIMITAGSNMGFHYAVLAIADPGDEIILPMPYYFNHEMAVTMAGCKPVLVATDADYHLQLECIEAAITPRTRAIVTVSPNNPSGAVYSRTELAGVNELCRVHGLYHISDEPYELFTWNDAHHFSPGALPEADRHTVSLFSFSKGAGLAGWRVGYMLLTESLVETFNKIQDTILICPSAASQYAALGTLEADRGYYRENIQTIGKVRQAVLEQLAALDGRIDPPHSEGAFYVLLRVHTKMRDMALVERLISKFGVAVIPGSAFGVQDGCTLRIAYGALQEQTVAEGIGRLVRGLKLLV